MQDVEGDRGGGVGGARGKGSGPHSVGGEVTLWGEGEHAERCTGSTDEASECLVPLYETVFHMSLNRR
jgi:hypothetical protein